MSFQIARRLVSPAACQSLWANNLARGLGQRYQTRWLSSHADRRLEAHPAKEVAGRLACPMFFHMQSARSSLLGAGHLSAQGMPRLRSQLPLTARHHDFPVNPLGTLGSLRLTTRNIGGRMFYKRRPKMVPRWKFNWRSKWLEGNPMKKGVCTKVMVTKPKKPNSGLRKTAKVRLSNGRNVLVYIPGIGHNLQVHSVVLVRGGRKRDVIGCNLTAMRGHYDLLPVKNRKSSRSKYGVPRPQTEPKKKRFKRLETAVDRRLYFYRTGQVVPPDTKYGDPDAVKYRIPYVVRNNPPVTYRGRKMGGKKK